MTTGQIALGVVGAIAGYFTGGAGWYLVGAMMMGAAAGVAMGSMLDPTASDIAGPGTPQMAELDFPTIEEGTVIYDVLGTTRLVGQIFWYGYGRTKQIVEKQKTGKGGGGKSTKVIVGYEYYLSWAQGLCLGPVDTLYTILRDEEPVWSGELNRPVSGGVETITLEGMGSLTFYFGTDDQVANSKIGDLVGATLNPSYRNLCYAYFDDCFIGSYNRAPRMRFILKKCPTYGFNANESIGDYDYNAAHMIYHFLVSPHYVGFPATWINETSFSDYADDMYGEDVGLSMLLSRQDAALKLIENCVTHMGAVLRYGIDGKFHLHKLRADTPILSLPEVTQDDFLEPMSITRKGWPDVVNEVQVQHHLRYNVEDHKPLVYFDPSDDFTGEDGSYPDAVRWTNIYGRLADIQGNRLRTDTVSYCGVITKCSFVGDFDTQIHYDYSQYTIGGRSRSFIHICRIYKDTSNYAACFAGINGSNQIEFNYNSRVGGSYQSGSSLPGSQKGWLRMARVGTTLYCYVKGDGIDPDWRLIHTRTGFYTDAVKFRFYSQWGGPYSPDFDCYWDDFTVNSALSNISDCGHDPLDPFTLNIRRSQVSADDRGTAETHGRAITKSVQLMLFGSLENANWAADRAVRRAAYPFAEGKIVLNRLGFKYEVGDLFRLSDSEHNIADMACRVMLIGEGPLDSEKINVDWMEEPDYQTQSAALALITTSGSQRDVELDPLVRIKVIEVPFSLVGEEIRILPLAGREKGTEIGYELWVSIDGGESYSFVDNITYYAIYGELVNDLDISVLTLDKRFGFEVDFDYQSEADKIETITRTQLFSNYNLALLGDEILNFETITPDGVVENRYKIENLNRGRIDSIRKTWPASTPFWYVGVNGVQVTSHLSYMKGATLSFKMVPYNDQVIGDISEAEVFEYTLVGRAKAPYVPANLNASGKSVNATYGRDVYLTWNPRVRGLDAGLQNPDVVIDAAAEHEGKFEVDVYDETPTLVRTETDLSAYAWKYSEAMNIADNGSLASKLTFALTNYGDSDGVRYTSIHERTLDVTLVPSTTTTTTTTT